MNRRTPASIDTEIEALRARIRRLRLERKAATLAETEAKLLKLARGGQSQAARPPEVSTVVAGIVQGDNDAPDAK